MGNVHKVTGREFRLATVAIGIEKIEKIIYGYACVSSSTRARVSLVACLLLLLLLYRELGHTKIQLFQPFGTIVLINMEGCDGMENSLTQRIHSIKFIGKSKEMTANF